MLLFVHTFLCKKQWKKSHARIKEAEDLYFIGATNWMAIESNYSASLEPLNYVHCLKSH